MEFVFGWMPFVLAGVVAIGVAIVMLLTRGRRSRADKDVVVAAHLDRLLALPEYGAAYRRSQRLLVVLLATVVVALVSLMLVAARPVTNDVVKSDAKNRDIVLCLDVSGSMLPSDAEVLDRFSQIVDQFKGERISLVIWNSTATQVFPLTDDYDYVSEQLTSAAKAAAAIDPYNLVAPSSYDLYSGTLSAPGASLIGDGLASCVLRFDHTDKERSRTILLATDNELNGEPIVTLEEAATFAKERDVRVYTITPPWLFEGDTELTGLQDASTLTGGDTFSVDEDSASDDIVQKVLAEQASHLEGTPQLVVTDHPGVLLVIGILALWAIVYAGWRVRS